MTTYYPGRISAAPVGAFDLGGVVSAGVNTKASGGSTAAALSAAGSVFGPIGTVVGGLVGSLLGGGPCKGVKQNPKAGVPPALSEAQAVAWAQAANPGMINTWQKCVASWGNISFPEFVSWHYREYRSRYKNNPLPAAEPPAPAPAPASTAVAAPGTYRRPAVAYQPAAYTAYSPATVVDDPAARQRAAYRALIDTRLSEYRAALAGAERNYQAAYAARDAGAANAWANYYNQVAAGLSSLEQQRIQYAA